MGKHKGTAIGLIVAAVVVTAAGVFWLTRPNPRRNEPEVIRSLKRISRQQAIYKQQPETDQDDDGVGEYGFLAELSGRITPRVSLGAGVCRIGAIHPALIPSEFGSTREAPLGIAGVSGYYYQLWLPGPNGPVDDRYSDATEQIGPRNILDPETDRPTINQQEKRFVLYAWPVAYGETGIATYVINELGECYRTAGPRPSAKRYNGATLMPAPDAAFAKGQPVFTGKLANGEGIDGNLWEPVEHEATFDRASKPDPHDEQDAEKRPDAFHRRGRRDPFQ
ncbi:MAG: DUF2950 family protein [Planctomycetota bacterium]